MSVSHLTFSSKVSGTVHLFIAAALSMNSFASSVLPRSNNHLTDSGINLVIHDEHIISHVIVDNHTQKQ